MHQKTALALGRMDAAVTNTLAEVLPKAKLLGSKSAWRRILNRRSPHSGIGYRVSGIGYRVSGMYQQVPNYT